MKYKHIVFDIDGTLIDTEYAVLHSLQETIKGLSGREIPCSELRFALGITGTDALKNMRDGAEGTMTSVFLYPRIGIHE